MNILQKEFQNRFLYFCHFYWLANDEVVFFFRFSVDQSKGLNKKINLKGIGFIRGKDGYPSLFLPYHIIILLLLM